MSHENLLKLMSIRVKFLIWFNFASLFIILLFSIITYLSVIHGISESIDNRLKSVAEATAFIVQRSDIPISCGSKEFGEMLEAFLGYKDTEGYVKIIDSDNKVVSCTTHILTEKITLNEADIKKLKNGNLIFGNYPEQKENKEKKVRVLFYPLFRDGKYMGYLEVGSSLSRLYNMQRSLLHIFLIVIPVVLAVANIGGLIIFNKSFHTIIFLSNEMKKITAQHLYKRLPELEGSDELATLYASINDMIARLEKSFEQIKQFSGDASHELRTPLTIIKGEVEVALRSERTVEEYQQILVSILEEIERMTNIVENLLLGEILVDKKPVNVKEVIFELCDQLEMFGKEKNISLIYDDLEDGVIEGDRLRLRQVFTNIIVNAIKYNVVGGMVVITVKDLPKGVMVTVEDTGYEKMDNKNLFAVVIVEDSGIGIPADKIEKIFDRFYRSDKSRKREEGGAGLGLSICKSIIEAHDGYIDVESEYGKGSKFSIWLPKKVT